MLNTLQRMVHLQGCFCLKSVKSNFYKLQLFQTIDSQLGINRSTIKLFGRLFHSMIIIFRRISSVVCFFLNILEYNLCIIIYTHICVCVCLHFTTLMQPNLINAMVTVSVMCRILMTYSTQSFKWNSM